MPPKRTAVHVGIKDPIPFRPFFIYFYRLRFNESTRLYYADAMFQDVNGPYRRVRTGRMHFTAQQLWLFFRSLSSPRRLCSVFREIGL